MACSMGPKADLKDEVGAGFDVVSSVVGLSDAIPVRVADPLPLEPGASFVAAGVCFT